MNDIDTWPIEVKKLGEGGYTIRFPTKGNPHIIIRRHSANPSFGGYNWDLCAIYKRAPHSEEQTIANISGPDEYAISEAKRHLRSVWENALIDDAERRLRE